MVDLAGSERQAKTGAVVSTANFPQLFSLLGKITTSSLCCTVYGILHVNCVCVKECL